MNASHGDCDRALARSLCGERGEPSCLQLGCPRCAQEQILKTQFEYGVIANAIGERAALKAAVRELGLLRAHIGRSGDAGPPPVPVSVVRCNYCGGSDHRTESPAGERCREAIDREIELERRALASGGANTPGDIEAMNADAEAEAEADEAASRADAASDWARDEEALAALEDRAEQDALTQEAEDANAGPTCDEAMRDHPGSPESLEPF